MKRYLDQRLKIRHLRVLDAISSHRSLLRAAEALNLTQPALTKALREMEDLLGARLFDRHAKGVTPNAAGERVLVTARQVLLELNRLDKDLDAILEGGAALVVGALPTACVGVIPGVLVRMRAWHPQVKIRVVEGRNVSLLAALAVGDVDLVVGRHYPPQGADDLERAPLYDEPIRCLVRRGHPLLARPEAGPEAMADYPFALPTHNDRVAEDIERYLEQMGIAPRETLHISSAPATRELMLSIDAIAPMPRFMMSGDILRGDIWELPQFGAGEARPAGLTMRRGPLVEGAYIFVDALRDYLREVGALAD